MNGETKYQVVVSQLDGFNSWQLYFDTHQMAKNHAKKIAKLLNTVDQNLLFDISASSSPVFVKPKNIVDISTKLPKAQS